MFLLSQSTKEPDVAEIESVPDTELDNEPLPDEEDDDESVIDDYTMYYTEQNLTNDEGHFVVYADHYPLCYANTHKKARKYILEYFRTTRTRDPDSFFIAESPYEYWYSRNYDFWLFNIKSCIKKFFIVELDNVDDLYFTTSPGISGATSPGSGTGL